MEVQENLQAPLQAWHQVAEVVQAQPVLLVVMVVALAV